MKAQLFFAWFDFWVGLFWNKKQSTLYILPFPMVGVRIKIIPLGFQIKKVYDKFSAFSPSGSFIGIYETWDDAFTRVTNYPVFKTL